jgi:diacylglycerol kinase
VPVGWRGYGAAMRGLWERHGARLRHWAAVVVTIVVVLTYMGVRDTEADWTVFLLAVGLLLVLEFLFSGAWLRRKPPDRRD